MSSQQNERFKYINQDDPIQDIRHNISNDKNKLNQFAANMNIMGIQNGLGGLGWKSIQTNKLIQNSNSKIHIQQITQQQKQKDRRIRKLTNINKHLLQQLKQQNDQLTKRVNKQKFKMPKKYNHKIISTNQQTSKLLQATKRQLQNVYGQIQYYKETISILKAKQMPSSQMDKVNEQVSRLRQKNQQIQRIQQQIRTQKAIKAKQSKQLQKIQNEQTTLMQSKLNDQIKSSKTKLKQLKKTLIKRQQLQKKQHTYLIELQRLIKKKRQQQIQKEQNQNEINKKLQLAVQQQITQLQWKQIKQKLFIQKKKYQQYGKKINYLIYMKSKQSKYLEEIQLKHKQKINILQKLKSKLNQVNKLAQLTPKPSILQKVDLKMEKLKDIITRQNTIQMQKINKIKPQSQDTRHFKKWQLQHASRQNQSHHNNIYNINNQSQQDSIQIPQSNSKYYSPNDSQNQLIA